MTPEEFYYERKKENRVVKEKAATKKIKVGKSASFSVHNDKAVIELRKLADQSRRSLNNYIAIILEQAIAKKQTNFSYSIDNNLGLIRISLLDLLKKKEAAEKLIFKKKESAKKKIQKQIEIAAAIDNFKRECFGRYILNKKTHRIVEKDLVINIYKNDREELIKITKGEHDIYKLTGKKIDYKEVKIEKVNKYKKHDYGYSFGQL